MIWLGPICYNDPIFCEVAVFVKYCYTTGSWLCELIHVRAAHHSNPNISKHPATGMLWLAKASAKSESHTIM